MHRTLSAVAALAMTAGTLAFAVPAHAAPADDSVSISIEGLDPTSPADVARIDRRVRAAARDLCGSDLIQPVRLRERASACEGAMVADARNAVRLAAAKPSTPFRLALRIR